jgi:hypothetical protein
MSGGKSGLTAAVRVVLAAAAVVLLGVVAVGVVGLADQDERPDSRQQASTSADRSAGPDVTASAGPPDRGSTTAARQSSPPPKDKAVAGRAVSSYLEKVPAVLSRRPKETESLVARIGTATFADELRANAAYNRKNGVRVVGSPTVSGLKVLRVDLDAQPPTAVVEACIDSSAVRIVDTRGRTVPQPRHARTREQFSLVWSGDRWLIDSQGFPDDPNC